MTNNQIQAAIADAFHQWLSGALGATQAELHLAEATLGVQSSPAIEEAHAILVRGDVDAAVQVLAGTRELGAPGWDWPVAWTEEGPDGRLAAWGVRDCYGREVLPLPDCTEPE